MSAVEWAGGPGGRAKPSPPGERHGGDLMSAVVKVGV